ncbi:MAG: tetratricopeptide repeat protein [Bacteroidetes bacterium]|nr:tetratricopeptide repeat protein [Bacteroidota bacterium]
MNINVMQHPGSETPADRIGAIELQLAAARDPRARLDLITRFVEELRTGNPRYAAGLAAEGLHQAYTLRDIVATAVLLLARGCARVALGELRAGLADLEEAHGLYVDAGNCEQMARAAQELGRCHLAAGAPAVALEWLRAALEAAADERTRPVRARTLEALGDLRTGLGDYAAALEHYLEAMALFEGLGDRDGSGAVLCALGMLYARTGDHARALENLIRSAKMFQETGNRLAEVRTLHRLAEAQYAADDLEGAIANGLRALTIYEALGDTESATHVMATIGKVHATKGEHAVALGLLMRAYAHLDASRSHALRVDILTTIGRLYADTEAYDDAFFVLSQALGMAEQIDEPPLQQEIHKVFADAYERLGRAMQALEHYKRYSTLRDDLAGRERQKAIAELQIRFDVAAAERDREIYRLRAVQLETEMRLKGNELTAMALNLVQKKELLEQMRERLIAMRGNGVVGAGELVERMIAEIDGARNADTDWKRFEQQLDNLHHDFVRTLSERFPTLTPAEVKVCSLARIDLPTKDIANLLYASTRTIDAHKYRIRRKLGLAPNVSLSTFLAGL